MVNNNNVPPAPPKNQPENIFISPTDKYVLVRMDDTAQQVQVLASAVVKPSEATIMMLRALMEFAPIALGEVEQQRIQPVSPIIKI